MVVGEDLGVVSGCVLALMNLLRPLKWAGPVIVTLPAYLHAYLESPVPLILGMQSLPDGFKLGPGIIMIDPKVCMSMSSRENKSGRGEMIDRERYRERRRDTERAANELKDILDDSERKMRRQTERAEL